MSDRRRSRGPDQAQAHAASTAARRRGRSSAGRARPRRTARAEQVKQIARQRRAGAHAAPPTWRGLDPRAAHRGADLRRRRGRRSARPDAVAGVSPRRCDVPASTSRPATTWTCSSTAGAARSGASQPAQARLASRPHGRAHVHRRAGAENCFLLRRDGSDQRADRRPGRGGPALLAAIEQLGVTLEASCSRTRTSTTSAPSRPSRRPPGAGVVPEIERPVLADIMSFVPVAGLRAVRELRGRPRSRAASARAGGVRHRRGLHARPQPRPRDLLDPRRARRSSPATSSSRARSAAPTCPAATGATLLASIAGLLDAYRTRRSSTRATWASRRSAPSARRTRSSPSSRVACRPASAKLQAPRGTYDVLPETAAAARRLEAAARRSSARAGYGRIETPVFEDTDLFARGVGESTDIVQKEMYTFEDRGGRSLTLRPEGTAPICRAYVEHGMHKLPQPVKLWYRRALLPLRGAAGRPLPPVRADRRGGDRLRRPGARRRVDPAARPSCSTRARCATCACGSRSLGDAGDARRLPRGAARLPARARGRAVRGGARAASTRTRCGRSTPTTRGRAR